MSKDEISSLNLDFYFVCLTIIFCTRVKKSVSCKLIYFCYTVIEVFGNIRPFCTFISKRNTICNGSSISGSGGGSGSSSSSSIVGMVCNKNRKKKLLLTNITLYASTGT